MRRTAPLRSMPRPYLETADQQIPAAEADEAERRVAVADVTFGYPDHPHILNRLSLDTSADVGLTVLTGPSGSGKSTLLDLIAGIRTPTSGSIRARRAHLATQRPLVLPGPVADVVRLGAPDASDSACQDVANGGALVGVGRTPGVGHAVGR